MGCVYIAENLSNGKVYIGKTVKPMPERRGQHLRDANNGSNLYFHRSLRKYGEGGFSWSVLATHDDNKRLLEMEKAFIKEYASNADGFGYNLTPGGEGVIVAIGGDVALKRLNKAYSEVNSLLQWCLETLLFLELGGRITQKTSKKKPGFVAMYLSHLPKSIKTLLAIKENMESAFMVISDRNCKYHVDGYFRSVVKAAH